MQNDLTVQDLEAQLNDFDAAVRAAALVELVGRWQAGALMLPPQRDVANMHCHTFFSYNAYGYSPSGLAWLARKNGYRLMGIVDFDVLDAVDEFLDACDLVGVRGSAGHRDARLRAGVRDARDQLPRRAGHRLPHGHRLCIQHGSTRSSRHSGTTCASAPASATWTSSSASTPISPR